MAKKSTPVVESDSDIVNRRAQVIKELLSQEPCGDVIKSRCMKIAKQVAESIKKLTDFVMVKIGEGYRSMPVDSFKHEIDGLKRLVKLMIEEIQRKLKQQPQPAV